MHTLLAVKITLLYYYWLDAHSLIPKSHVTDEPDFNIVWEFKIAK